MSTVRISGTDVKRKMENYLKISEAAKKLSVRQDTLRDWVQEGLVPVARTPKGGIRISEADLADVFKRGVWSSRRKK